MIDNEQEKVAPITYRDLAARMQSFTDTQLDSPIRLWGDSFAPSIVRAIDILEEDYIIVDSRDGFEPRSVYASELASGDLKESEIEQALPAGTVTLLTDY